MQGILILGENQESDDLSGMGALVWKGHSSLWGSWQISFLEFGAGHLRVLCL